METPSSTRRITRSQTMSTRKIEDSSSKKGRLLKPKQDCSVLIDITNDSPIVGLASGSLMTPVSSILRQKSKIISGSGEALLRCQVKTLLQKVEEEEGEFSKFSIQSRDLKAGGLVAPTPANTPQLLNFSSAVDDLLYVSQEMSGNSDGKKQEENGSPSEKDLVTRSLFMDFSDKSDSSSECSSLVTYQGTIEVGSQEKSATLEDDDASIWSIQVNASTRDEDDDENEVIENDVEADDYDDEDYIEEAEDEENDLLFLDELCEGVNKISVNGEKKGAAFKGKHTVFVYDSDDELVEEREEDYSEILRLKGLPTPKGKHLRFKVEGGDDEQ